MQMIVGITRAGLAQMYLRPGGWTFSEVLGNWTQKNNAYCGCDSILRCKCGWSR